MKSHESCFNLCKLMSKTLISYICVFIGRIRVANCSRYIHCLISFGLSNKEGNLHTSVLQHEFFKGDLSLDAYMLFSSQVFFFYYN